MSAVAAPTTGAPAPPAGWTRLARVRVRPTRRAGLFAFLGLLLYGAGANVASGWTIVLAALLLGSLPFAAVNAWRAAARVDVRREVPLRAATDEPVRVRIAVRAPTAAHLVVRDDLANAAGVAAQARDDASLAGAAVLHRGVVGGGTVEVRLADPFGLVTAVARGTVPSEVEVVPAGVPVRGADARVPWALEAGRAASAEGAGPEILGVREYQHGDPVRAIHWRSSARRDQLVVRELAEESRPRVRVELAAGDWSVEELDLAAEAACGVAEDARRGGYPVDVAADGSTLPWNPSARGLLARLPPHADAEPRPLAPPPVAPAEITIAFAPVRRRAEDRAGGPVGVAVRATRADRHADLGVLPVGLARSEIGPLMAGWMART